jgi:hypothetical protein
MDNVVSNKLEDHIDEPIKRAVALMNLYGVSTIFSCCGFAYKGEKVQKSHVFSCPQILFKCTTRSLNKISKLIHTNKFAMNNGWNASLIPTRDREPFTKGYIGCRLRSEIKSWEEKDSPHFHEACNSAITILEERLLEFVDSMPESVLVRDYNEIMKKAYPYWQYDPCTPWLVKKSDFV